MSTHKYELVKEEPLSGGSRYRKLLLRLVRFATGNIVGYDLKHEGPSVSVVALDEQQRFILVEQFRGGANKRLIEIPGGLADHGNMISSARQELFEETGYSCHDSDLEYVGQMFVCAYSTGVHHVFVARNCVKLENPQGQGIEQGDLIVVLMTLQEFLRHLRSGELTTVEAGYRALDHLGYLRPSAP